MVINLDFEAGYISLFCSTKLTGIILSRDDWPTLPWYFIGISDLYTCILAT